MNQKDKISKKYNNTKLVISISKAIITFILIFLFVALGYSEKLADLLYTITQNDYLVLLFFVITTGIISSIIFAPVNFYTEFYLEHKYNLSNQTFIKWIWENLKGVIISAVIGLPLLLLFYYVMNKFGSLWWLPFAIIIFLLSVVLARIVPILILPLFYKISPLENDELKSRIEKLASEAGMKLKNVFSFNMSKNTKKANAAFTGIGKSKRILLGDTLLENFTNDEIETVIAHEMGHYKKKHIIKNIVFGTVMSFLTLFILAYLYETSLIFFGFTEITQISALPLLTLWGMIIGLIQTPLGSYISRKYEYEADEYAVKSTLKPDAFISTLEKLNDQNLADKNPHPFVEWFFYSHPSIKKRITYIGKVKQNFFSNNLDGSKIVTN